jgi:hypothetical protein
MNLYKLIGLILMIVTGTKALQAQSIGLTTENDAYLLKKEDAYYTNGLFFHYSYAKPGKLTSRRIHQFTIGQKIFTPLFRNTRTPADIDRPYAGYSFAQFSQTRFSGEKTVFQWSGTLGIIGPASGGEGLQNTYHRWLNFAEFRGWKYQINNQLVLNAAALYAYQMVNTQLFKGILISDAQLGTGFVSASMGTKWVYGLLNSAQQSQLWNAAPEIKGNNKKEFYIYWYPRFTWQGYNATISGGSKTAADSSVRLTPHRWVFQHTLGLAYSAGRWAAQLELVHQSRETLEQLKKHRYLGLQLQYRIH